MAEKPGKFFERCAFFTTVKFKGLREDGKPIWGDTLNYDQDLWPTWDDWTDIQHKYIIPLCSVANSATLFGIEWRSDRTEVLEFRKFIEEHFSKQGRRLVCNKPTELTDVPLFWSGGGKAFSIIKVLSFNMEQWGFVFDVLQQHSFAGELIGGGPGAPAINFAKSVVQKGGFAVIFFGIWWHLYFPIEYKDQVDKSAHNREREIPHLTH